MDKNYETKQNQKEIIQNSKSHKNRLHVAFQEIVEGSKEVVDCGSHELSLSIANLKLSLTTLH